ncbi:RNA ligase family protein [Bacillus sp. NPDC077027]|uniref:RNA ligase family protein n=1 Tax=Bacillus sp. NPDC077027 TaxID=3390548 RepID=UPI003D012B4C
MEQKKYISIKRMGHSDTRGMFQQGDFIIITEKIDCSNASFSLDEKGALQAFSRNVQLDEQNNLNGFYQWVHENINPNDLASEYIYFGEWLGTPHKVHYPQHEKQFFLFDVWDKVEKEYITFWEVKWEAKHLQVNIVPVFYGGEFISYEHIESFVGLTALGGKIGEIESGEGIVVKNYRNQGFAKLVCEAFREVHGGAKEYKKPTELGAEAVFVSRTVTPARVLKTYFKLIDEQVLPNNLELEDMGMILKELVPAVQADILKEERELLPEFYDEKAVRKSVSKRVPQYIKEHLLGRA